MEALTTKPWVTFRAAKKINRGILAVTDHPTTHYESILYKKKAVTKASISLYTNISVTDLKLHFVANTQKLPKLENFQFPFQTLLDQQISRNDRYEITTTQSYVYINIGNVYVNIHVLVY